MADPTLQTFCCVHSSDTRLGADEIIRFRSGPYNIVCIISALFGCLGALYQILPRDVRYSRLSNSYKRGRCIVVWLATADLCACIALIIRSSIWLIRREFLPLEGNYLDTIFCAISSGWIQYFYSSACLWTFCYAMDIFFVLKNQEGCPLFYHMFCWGLPAITTSLGLFILYFPDINCHACDSNAFLRILPNYLFTYLPITFVMLVNPVIYIRASNMAEENILGKSGRYTNTEREQLRNIRIKFLCINLVFMICWVPNLLNALLLWTTWEDLPKKFLLSDWYFMAVVNPLQALLNSLVYGKWGDNRPPVMLPWRKASLLENEEFFSMKDDTTPLLLTDFEDSKTLSYRVYGGL